MCFMQCESVDMLFATSVRTLGCLLEEEGWQGTVFMACVGQCAAAWNVRALRQRHACIVGGAGAVASVRITTRASSPV